MALTQATRSMRLGTALGDDVLAFQSMRVEEGLSRNFEMDIEAISEDADLDFKSLLGTNVTVAVEGRGNEPRYFNGFVTDITARGMRYRNYAFRIVARPWLWFLSLRENCRIFHEKSAQQIIEDLFHEHGYGDFRFSLDESLKMMPYCVQYNETDLNFILRLLEDEGVYFYFEHENGKHTLVFSDSPFSHEPYPDYEVAYLDLFRRAGTNDVAEALRSWRPSLSIRTGRVLLDDYDYRNPGAALATVAASSSDFAEHGHIYNYPGRFNAEGVGARRAKARMNVLQTGEHVSHGEATLRGVCAGAKLTIEGADEGFGDDHLVVSAHHEMSLGSYQTGGEEVESYKVEFTAIPTSQPFAPPREALRPRIVGPQTAVVVGEGEVDPDDLGCVLVRFRWSGDAVSCRVRVSQAFASSGWGGLSNPRIGDEVIVEFEHGDPDRPIITGRVYNDAMKPPMDPSADPFVTTFKSNSEGGGNFNEFRFTDNSGAENIFLHAAKDIDIRIKETSRRLVGVDDHDIVEGDQFRQVEGAMHEDFGADAFRTVKDTYNLKADTILATGATEIVAKGGKIHVKADQTLVLEAGTQLSLKVGGNFIDIGPAGVSIKGTMVNINSGGSAGSGSGTAAAAAQKPDEPMEGEPGAAPAESSGEARTFTAQQLDANPAAAALRSAHESGAPFCEQCAKAAAEAANSGAA
ncbi:type VI secretion system Vgr family protein [Rubrimonas cliftonensis]|uniref:Type VI secretion system secreted protein VgrG n=1 Tax=Rubrimonas cliftonensis TaxID=89524 RepID=A0A1H4BHU9_9RHOB|nr:type VI secretion system tip protein TssI/VgrG [Rubrimonas cliftonensis]SEA47362.1 type VI secretion system secreted protein VgrG [Rubrimonas cliftonensis]